MILPTEQNKIITMIKNPTSYAKPNVSDGSAQTVNPAMANYVKRMIDSGRGGEMEGAARIAQAKLGLVPKFY